MTDNGEFTERYVAVWNEPDANARRMAISRIWSEDARACTAGADYAGLTAIEARVTKAHEEFVALERFMSCLPRSTGCARALPAPEALVMHPSTAMFCETPVNRLYRYIMIKINVEIRTKISSVSA